MNKPSKEQFANILTTQQFTAAELIKCSRSDKISILLSLLEVITKSTDKSTLTKAWLATDGIRDIIDTYGWARLATASAKLNHTYMLLDLWREAEKHPHNLNDGGWSAFAAASNKLNQPELLVDIWNQAKDSKLPGLKGRDWGGFAASAMKFRMKALFHEMWSCAKDYPRNLGGGGWSSFVTGTTSLNLPQELLESIWQHSIGHHNTLKENDWSSFATATSQYQQLDLREVWDAAQKSCDNFYGPKTSSWGGFATAACNLQLHDLFMDIWHVAKVHVCRLPGDAWGSFATATGRMQLPELLEEMWEFARNHQDNVRTDGYSSFIVAAGKLQRPELIQQIWNDTEEHRNLLPGAVWCKFATASAIFCLHDTLLDIWQSSIINIDQLNGEAWSGLASAAQNHSNHELFKEMWQTAIKHRTHLSGGGWSGFVCSAEKLNLHETVIDIWSSSNGYRHQLYKDDWCGFISAVTKLRRVDLVEEMWNCYQSSAQMTNNGEVWSAFIVAAATLKHAELFNQIWMRGKDRKQLFEDSNWQLLSIAANRFDLPRMLFDIWQYKDVRDGTVGSWGAFAKMATDQASPDLLVEVWTNATANISMLTKTDLGNCAGAAANLNMPELLDQMWSVAKELQSVLRGGVAVYFTQAFARLNNKISMDEAFDVAATNKITEIGWVVLVTSAAEAEHNELFLRIYNRYKTVSGIQTEKIWCAFLSAAMRLGDKEIDIIFDGLVTEFGPSRPLHRNNTLSILLNKTIERVDDKGLEAKISDHLHGYICDINTCLDIINSSQPQTDYSKAFGPMENATHCLIRWLINSYFRDDYLIFCSNLCRIATFITSIDNTKQEHVLTSFFAQGKECFVGLIKSEISRYFIDGLQNAIDKPDTEFGMMLTSGDISNYVAEFMRGLNCYIIKYHNHDYELKQDSNAFVEELSKHLLNNYELFLKHFGYTSNTEKSQYFATVNRIIIQHNIIHEFEDVIKELFRTMHRGMFNIMLEEVIPSNIHDIKKRIERLEKKYCSLTDTQHKSSICNQVRFIIDNFEAKWNISKAVKLTPINVAPLVSKMLLRDRLSNAATSAEAEDWRHFNIAAWGGARDELLEPMLRELREHVEEALARFESNRQFYNVVLRRGVDDFVSYGILNVENVYDPSAERSRTSTGKGTGIIQRTANMFGGRAYPSHDKRDGYHWHKWEIYLPLHFE